MFAFLIAQLPGAAFASTNDGEYYDHFVAYKYASKQALGPGETLTYTILLYNSTTDAVIADVVDMLPAELSVVDGTVSNGGMYDAGQITWSGVEVVPATEVKLTFDVVAPEEIDEIVKVTNVAKVTTADNVYETETTTTLLPEPPVDDVVNPVVESVVIDDKDVLTSREVTLHIKATDNVGVEEMLIQEFQVIEKPNSGKVVLAWDVTNPPHWVDYQETYRWTLGDLPGVHFVGVWVKDAAGNISYATQSSFDFASYLEDESTFETKITNIPYAVYYEAGVDVTATLTQLSGESGVMLYIWFPGNFEGVDIVGQPGEPVEFTTEKAGTYIFMVGVMAPAGVSYNLSITPEGGPSAWGETSGSVSINSSTTESTTMSLFGEVGVDPIAEAISSPPPLVPSEEMETVYLTMIFR